MRMTPPFRPLAALMALVLLRGTMITTAHAQQKAHYSQQTGESLYQGLCQGCHMPDARGAIGAGSYPALAKNARLLGIRYPISVVLRGQRAMPPFGENLSDDQIANVLNYVRTHFGNHYGDAVSAAAVREARQ
jgi:mono/diheme cytochrome c family protein